MRWSTGTPLFSRVTSRFSSPRPSVRGRRPWRPTTGPPAAPSRRGTQARSRRRRGALIRRCLAEAQLDALGGQRLTESVPEGLRLARQQVLHAFDQRHRGAETHTACAISTPTGPPPSTSMRSGTSRSPVTSRLVQIPIQLASPGIGGNVASDPVAMTMCSQEVSLPLHRHLRHGRDRARAAQDVDATRAQPVLLRGVLPVEVMKSRHSKAGGGVGFAVRRPARPPGASRAAWRASPGRSGSWTGCTPNSRTRRRSSPRSTIATLEAASGQSVRRSARRRASAMTMTS